MKGVFCFVFVFFVFGVVRFGDRGGVRGYLFFLGEFVIGFFLREVGWC